MTEGRKRRLDFHLRGKDNCIKEIRGNNRAVQKCSDARRASIVE